MKDEILTCYAPMINTALDQFFPESRLPQKLIFEAARYSLTAGGKRLRPSLFLAFYEQCGKRAEDALPFACALEMIHTYSLIHDDLPCMDDDDLRRGKPTSHKQFGEAIAVLAGDALLNRAFEIMLSAESIPPERAMPCAAYISRQSGVFGMIGGQVLDLRMETEFDPALLAPTADLKTAALLRAACVGGCILANANDSLQRAASQYATNLGMAFQIIDDLLDVSGDPEKLGKATNHDAQQGRQTFVTACGVEGCRRLAEQHTALAVKAASAFPNPVPLCALVQALEKREI